MDACATLTVSQLKAGHLYQVVDTGGRSIERHMLTVVMGTGGFSPFRAVTIRAAPGMERVQRIALGTTWGDDDTEARFLAHAAPVVLSNPL
jgi:hypothetical protein